MTHGNWGLREASNVQTLPRHDLGALAMCFHVDTSYECSTAIRSKDSCCSVCQRIVNFKIVFHLERFVFIN